MCSSLPSWWNTRLSSLFSSLLCRCLEQVKSRASDHLLTLSSSVQLYWVIASEVKNVDSPLLTKAVSEPEVGDVDVRLNRLILRLWRMGGVGVSDCIYINIVSFVFKFARRSVFNIACLQTCVLKTGSVMLAVTKKWSGGTLRGTFAVIRFRIVCLSVWCQQLQG
jgi:hypothetical protein